MNEQNKTQEDLPDQSVKKPNETGSFEFSGTVKITDPVSGEVLLHVRAD